MATKKSGRSRRVVTRAPDQDDSRTKYYLNQLPSFGATVWHRGAAKDLTSDGKEQEAASVTLGPGFYVVFAKFYVTNPRSMAVNITCALKLGTQSDVGEMFQVMPKTSRLFSLLVGKDTTPATQAQILVTCSPSDSVNPPEPKITIVNLVITAIPMPELTIVDMWPA